MGFGHVILVVVRFLCWIQRYHLSWSYEGWEALLHLLFKVGKISLMVKIDKGYS